MITKRLTYILLGLFLILSGLANFITGIDSNGIVIHIFSVFIGILILVATPGISMFFGWIAASLYLLFWGGSALLNVGFPGMNVIIAVIALIAGILLIVRTPGIKKYFGFLLFCVWLILLGITGLLSISNMETAIAGVAIASGLLILLDL